jgi:acetylglutamate kinase
LRVVVKIGGAALDDAGLRRKCASAVAALAEAHQVTVVHGGGVALTRVLAQLGKKSEFVNGLRITDSETRDVALMVLAGAVNKQLVAELATIGHPGVGMCGGDGAAFLARKKKVSTADLGFVGEVSSVNVGWIEAIWNFGAIPVISSVALGSDGQYYNVNADQMATACAVALHAHALIFLTDVSGVHDASGTTMRWLSTSQIPALTREAVIAGGMLPKLAACEEALRRGVGRVRILPAVQAGLLPDFYLSKIDVGTEVTVA